jgi:hypothetical protein
VASSRDVEARLAHLEQILAQTTSTSSSGTDASAAGVHLASVPLERIRRLMNELRADGSRDIDDTEALIMRLLLNEYATAVAHLRAVAALAATVVDGAGPRMRDARRAVHRHTKSVEGAAQNAVAQK